MTGIIVIICIITYRVEKSQFDKLFLISSVGRSTTSLGHFILCDLFSSIGLSNVTHEELFCEVT